MSVESLSIRALAAGYGGARILKGIDLEIAPGQITAIVGANACGKSTLLRAMSRLLTPESGEVLLDGTSVHATAPRALARRLGLLPQAPQAPEAITVLDLVSRGRHPHQGIFGGWSAQDEAAVAEALELTGTDALAEREVAALSGGQRQRVWIAMALAQQTEVLLLDEPTTYLDVNHQVEVLDLLTDLNRRRGTTIVMVLHELNLAARYADRLVAMRAGEIHAEGAPGEVLTETMLRAVFDLEARVMDDPVSGRPLMIPLGRHGLRANEREEARR
ncbi:ABC transporter ATP-binding protein [Pseudooceanicola marinus]|uniref:ABC transporter ATP-binding protein n=1 Tax=Pseudooceanicola marinus TaxID=396013 RepID=UPI001CD1FC5D|nr:ABC transporter ATP-binding protein [Pseudooceanicola marinus]MCA1334570.1 ABC transporter ATP-binding protein [Pseudooceanicola marinus]